MKEKKNKDETAQPVSQKTKTTSSSKKKKGKAQPALDTVSQETKTTQSSKENEDEKAQPLDHTTVSQLEKKSVISMFIAYISMFDNFGTLYNL